MNILAKIPKLALIGFVVLLIGFSPEILVIANIDTVGPIITNTRPSSTNMSDPDPLTPGINYLLLLTVSTNADVNRFRTYCDITWMTTSGAEGTRKVSLGFDEMKKEFSGWWTVPVDAVGIIQFQWYVEDLAENPTERTTYGELGDADGIFSIKDGNDPAYTVIDQTIDTITFNHNMLFFEFNATNAGWAIERVWIEVNGQHATDLSTEVETDSKWNSSYIVLPDGTYEITGHFRAFSQDWQTMSLLIGQGEDPEPPTPWSTYDWLKIIGGALLVVGFIWKK